MAKKFSNAFKVPGFLKDVTTNKYVLYLVAFFALTNVIGYMMLGKNVCVLLFVLIAYATTQFTKNMVFVLLVPMFLVGFFSLCAPNKREGAENMVEADIEADLDDLEDDEVDTEEDEADVVEDEADVVEDEDTLAMDVNTLGGDDDEDAFTNAGAKKTGGRAKIDYASTIEDAYDNLNGMLGADGIKSLTSDTQNLVKQQMQLAESMKGMGPLLTQAKDMLKTLNLDGLGGEIGSLAKKMGGLKK